MLIVEDGKVDVSQKDLIDEKDREDCRVELKVQDEKNIKQAEDEKERNREHSGSVVECLTRDQGFEPHRSHCIVSLSKTH